MGNFFNEVKSKFNQKDILVQLIIINIVVFIALGVMNVVTKLFNLHGFYLVDYLGISSDISGLVKFWTPLTYMFIHLDIWHLLLNMLILYWFGRLFLSSFSGKTLGSLYVLGGLAGAVLYMFVFNIVPYYVNLGHVPMIGASAAVMAIVFGIAFYNPNMSIRLILIGEIKILYIAIFFFILDFFALGSDVNPGGHVAHIGGAALGYLFANQYLKGRDITRWLTKSIDSIASLSLPKKKAKMTAKFNKRESDYNYNSRAKATQDEIDSILDKIKTSGYSSLSKDEKQKLFNASNK